MSRARYHDPNLAAAPFENVRPVQRLSLALWILALLVGAAALWLMAGARRDAGSRQAELARLSAEVTALRTRTVELRAGLEKAQLAERNQRTEFLNQRIAERAFSWNDLFEALGEVLPRGVRVQTLTPQGFGSVRNTRRGAAAEVSPATNRILMQIAGEAEESEALLEFVDRLYLHPAFGDPNLSREATKKDERTDFDLSVGYTPGWRAARELERTAVLTPDGAPAEARGAVLPAGAGSTGAALPAAEATALNPTAPPAEAGAPTAPGVRSTRPPAAASAGTRAAGTRGAPTASRVEREAPFDAAREDARDPSEPSSSAGRARTTPARESSRTPAAFALPAPLRPYASGPGGRR